MPRSTAVVIVDVETREVFRLPSISFLSKKLGVSNWNIYSKFNFEKLGEKKLITIEGKKYEAYFAYVYDELYNEENFYIEW